MNFPPGQPLLVFRQDPPGVFLGKHDLAMQHWTFVGALTHRNVSFFASKFNVLSLSLQLNQKIEVMGYEEE